MLLLERCDFLISFLLKRLQQLSVYALETSEHPLQLRLCLKFLCENQLEQKVGFACSVLKRSVCGLRLLHWVKEC